MKMSKFSIYNTPDNGLEISISRELRAVLYFRSDPVAVALFDYSKFQPKPSSSFLGKDKFDDSVPNYIQNYVKKDGKWVLSFPGPLEGWVREYKPGTEEYEAFEALLDTAIMRIVGAKFKRGTKEYDAVKDLLK
jgi:hypothetical protein